MKVYIGPYKNWIGPYQIAEFLMFWKKRDEDDIIDDSVHNFGKWLAEDKNQNPTRLLKLCNWIEEKKKRNVKIRIDDYDVWGMDSTLGLIVLPMLKTLRDRKAGSPYVDDEDTPVELRSSSAPPKEHEYDTDDNHHKRWEWILNEMIFAFESQTFDWDDQFWLGKHDNRTMVPTDETISVEFGPNDTRICDWDGRCKYQKRITNGFRLFGKYYEGLWS